MKGNELLSLWASPDNSRLTAKQFSVRFPLHVAAKISALCDMYPNKNRTEIIGDLLSAALEEVQKGLAQLDEEYLKDDPGMSGGEYEQTRPGTRFWKYTKKYLEELESELDSGKSGN